jgi:Family of unknown function (DUF6101)
MPAGSGRVERLDPFALPVQFENADPAADGRVRMVEIHRERVVLRRALRGMKMAISLPSAAYRGVAIRMPPPTANLPPEIAIVLAHPDPALSVTLSRAFEADDVLADWRSWGRALGVPLLVEGADGRLREPFRRVGGVRAGLPARRRRRRSALHLRRASLPLRRRRVLMPMMRSIHQGEREIIARN